MRLLNFSMCTGTANGSLLLRQFTNKHLVYITGIHTLMHMRKLCLVNFVCEIASLTCELSDCLDREFLNREISAKELTIRENLHLGK